MISPSRIGIRMSQIGSGEARQLQALAREEVLARPALKSNAGRIAPAGAVGDLLEHGLVALQVAQLRRGVDRHAAGESARGRPWGRGS